MGPPAITKRKQLFYCRKFNRFLTDNRIVRRRHECYKNAKPSPVYVKWFLAMHCRTLRVFPNTGEYFTQIFVSFLSVTLKWGCFSSSMCNICSVNGTQTVIFNSRHLPCHGPPRPPPWPPLGGPPPGPPRPLPPLPAKKKETKIGD